MSDPAVTQIRARSSGRTFRKKLIVCCDGTWNTQDRGDAPTNVAKMARAIPVRSGNAVQIVHYAEGVGTTNGLDRAMGGLFGIGLGANVLRAYRFLVQHWEPGDEILMFGYSRGAYTVRSLAGLVGLVGLLRRGDLEHLPEVYDYYRTPKEKRRPDWLTEHEDWFSEDGVRRAPDIAFLGVWDTVGALGIPWSPLRWLGRHRHAFHDVRLNPKVRHACQALAIDERRTHYVPTRWETVDERGQPLTAPGQTVEQVWFAGCHANVGGGYEDRVLSDIAFLWMVEKVGRLLDFDQGYLSDRVERVTSADMIRGTLVEQHKRGLWRLLRHEARELGLDRTERVHVTVDWRRARSAPYPFEPCPYTSQALEEFIGKLKTRGLTFGDMVVGAPAPPSPARSRNPPRPHRDRRPQPAVA